MVYLLLFVALLVSACGAAPPTDDPRLVTRPADRTTLCDEGDGTACRDMALELMEAPATSAGAVRVFNLLDRACQLGDVEGCYHLAVLWERGIGAPPNVEEARALYQAMCDRGHTSSCNNLALLVARVDGNLEESNALLQGACEQGDGTACFNLGWRAEQSGALEIAASQYRRACDLSFWEGCFYLGYMNRYGKGMPLDEAAGAELYLKSCDGGYGRACSSLGSLHEHGAGVEKSEAKASEFYERACKLGFARGCTNLGIAAERKGRGAALYEQACKSKDAKGCSRLGVAYLKGEAGVEKDPTKAFLAFKTSCELGYGPGCSNLGVMYEDGRGIDKDIDRAAELYDSACALEEFQGCHNLAAMYEDGIGVPKDMEKATDLYMKACEGGIAFSCSYLGSLWLKDADKARFGRELLKRGCDEGDSFGCDQLKEDNPT